MSIFRKFAVKLEGNASCTEKEIQQKQKLSTTIKTSGLAKEKPKDLLEVNADMASKVVLKPIAKDKVEGDEKIVEVE